MPYKWTHTGENENLACLQLWPHSSLPSGGFVGFIAVTFALILLPLFPLLGTAVLWGGIAVSYGDCGRDLAGA